MAAHRNPPLRKRSSTLTDDGLSTVGSVSPLLLHCQQGACLTCCYPFSNESGGWKAGVGFLNYHLLTQPLHTLPAPPAMARDTHSPCTWCVFQLQLPFSTTQLLFHMTHLQIFLHMVLISTLPALQSSSAKTQARFATST